MPHWVCLQPRPFVWPSRSPAPLLAEEKMREFTMCLSESDAVTVALMVNAQLQSLGIIKTKPESRYYRAAEDRVVADIVGLELDLWEIRAQIDEARAEAEYH